MSTQVPHSREAEASLLGACFVDSQVVLDALERVQPEMFYIEPNRLVYQAILSLVNTGRAVDLVTVAEELGGQLAHVGGYAYLTHLTQVLPTAVHAHEYAEAVRAYWLRRRLMAYAREISLKAADLDCEVDDVLDEAEGAVLGLRVGRPTDWLQKLGEKAIVHLGEMEQCRQVRGYKTGLVDVDRALGGLTPGELMILAARPSHGKTALALQIAHAVAAAGQGVLVFSLEMSSSQLVERLFSCLAGLDSYYVRLRNMRTEQWAQAATCASELATQALWVDDSAQLGLLELRNRARHVKARYGLAVVVVDYVQLLHAERKRGESRQQEVAEFTRGLKSLARELDISVLALSQLNRAVDHNPGKRPTLYNLRESGALEQDADVVAFLHRPPEEEDQLEPRTEFIVAKQRNGPTGSCWLRFRARYLRFVCEARKGIEQ